MTNRLIIYILQEKTHEPSYVKISN